MSLSVLPAEYDLLVHASHRNCDNVIREVRSDPKILWAIADDTKLTWAKRTTNLVSERVFVPPHRSFINHPDI